MFGKILQLFNREPKEVEPYIPDRDPIDWQPIVENIKDHVESHTIFLELKSGGFVKADESAYENKELLVTGIAVAYVSEGVKAWDTEVPAKYMQEKLSNMLWEKLPLMLSRDYKSFVGYYVYIGKT